jgi:hypothetical protein
LEAESFPFSSLVEETFFEAHPVTVKNTSALIAIPIARAFMLPSSCGKELNDYLLLGITSKGIQSNYYLLEV